jgi:hypothetical protein
MQPQVANVPSRLGQVQPASAESFHTRAPNFFW